MTGFRTQVTTTLSVRDWARAMDFYGKAFGARELYRVPGGGVGRLAIDGAEFWVAEESPAHLNFSPQTLGGCSVRMLLLVEDAAAVQARAIAAGRRRSFRSRMRTAGAWAAWSTRSAITGRSAGRSSERTHVVRALDSRHDHIVPPRRLCHHFRDMRAVPCCSPL